MRELLSRRQKQRIIDASRVLSAVLVPIYRKEGKYYILFTKRTEEVSTHKGQISFPGGAFNQADKTLLNTALREADEEIGMVASDVEILGELDDQRSIASNYIITPFVGFIPWPYQFTLCRAETDRLIESPILALLEEGGIRRETEIIDGKAVIAYSYVYRGDVIWGATARILGQFLNIFAQLITEKGETQAR